MKFFLKYSTACVLALALLLPATQALANVAANTEIVNNARLTFDGGSANASVTVRVDLVPSQPNVTITDANGAYSAPDSPALTNSVEVTSTANGPASYTVTPEVVTTAGATTNTTDPSVTGGDTITIGASVTTGTSGTTYVTVPASGAIGNNASVNGIGVNDLIVFTAGGNTHTKTVTSTTDNGDGTFRLNWSGAILAGEVPASGVQIGEQVTLNLSVLPGTVQTPGTNITVTVQATVSTTGAADFVATNGNANFWITPSPNASMTKYVRNLTGANPTSGGTTLTVNTFTREYFTSGVTGKTGDTLEYVLVASNTGGAGLTGCAISDLVPVDFVTFQTGVYGSNDVFYIAPDSTTATFAAGAVGANQASFVAGNDPNLIVNVGTGATNALTGTIAASQSVTIAYQVSIK